MQDTAIESSLETTSAAQLRSNSGQIRPILGQIQQKWLPKIRRGNPNSSKKSDSAQVRARLSTDFGQLRRIRARCRKSTPCIPGICAGRRTGAGAELQRSGSAGRLEMDRGIARERRKVRRAGRPKLRAPRPKEMLVLGRRVATPTPSPARKPALRAPRPRRLRILKIGVLEKSTAGGTNLRPSPSAELPLRSGTPDGTRSELRPPPHRSTSHRPPPDPTPAPKTGRELHLVADPVALLHVPVKEYALVALRCQIWGLDEAVALPLVEAPDGP